MKISFMGAAEEVTGSNFIVEFENLKFSIDCGMVQGSKSAMERNYEEFKYNPAELDFVILTHAHIDHSGLLPKLVKNGFKGPIYCTKATSDLLPILLRDSAHIQDMETERYNRKRKRKGLPEVTSVYDINDVEKTLTLVTPLAYHEISKISDKLNFTLYDAGHILGSAFVRIKCTTDDGEMVVVFSGDLGNSPVPILKDPEKLNDCDYLIMESTYGNRIRENDTSRMEKLAEIINRGKKSGGKIIIPSFAVGRTQELLYDLSELFHEKKIAPIDVYVDSPMATNTTSVFKNHSECFDKETRERLRNDDNPLDFPGLKFTQNVQESMALNETEDQCIIISASGMCTAGRIKHHLKHNIYKDDTTILFIGYQGVGTLGRLIKSGAKMVRIHGQQFMVNATIESIEGFSAHADQRGLIEWSTQNSKKPKKIILVHGEPDAQQELKNLLTNDGIDTFIPKLGECIELKPSGFRKDKSAIVLKHNNRVVGDSSILKEELIMLADLQTQLSVLSNKVNTLVKKISERL